MFTESIINQAREIVKTMPLEEKVKYLQGTDFWHLYSNTQYDLPEIIVTDGPHGLRKQTGQTDHVGLNSSLPAICYPAACMTSCSFDRELLYEIGTHLGEECLKEEISVLLGPAVNHKRSPLCGRNFEYFSEDPLLTGKLASELVKGIQSKGVGTCVKHYAANSQEELRLTSNSIIDERALFEIYLRQFEIIIKESNPASLMSAYNQLNDIYCSESQYLLEEIGRKKFGFNGLYITDWGAMNDEVKAYASGLDLEMPGICSGTNKIIYKAIQDKLLEESKVDEAVVRIISLILHFKQLSKKHNFDVKESLKLAQKVAEESAVLLKNEDHILPLESTDKLLIIGHMAKKARYQGSGSSKINPVELDNILEALHERNIPVTYCEGYDQEGTTHEAYLKEVIEAAKNHERIIIVAGLPDSYESEGKDRESLDMPKGMNQVIEVASQHNSNVIVVLQGGSAMTMPWIEKVKAVLHMHLSGCQGGKATVSLLLGEVNPSGKLTETYPFSLEDTPCYPYYRKQGKVCEYRESIYTGYRYYESVNKPVLFPFGYGLSYTTFEYSDIRVKEEKYDITVSFRIHNTGKKEGKEIYQIYFSQVNSVISRPDKQLVEFGKVSLLPNESKKVIVHISKEHFKFFDMNLHDWNYEEGMINIMVGASVADIRLSEQVEVHFKDNQPIVNQTLFEASQAKNQTREDFEKLVGREIKDIEVTHPFDHNVSFNELSKESSVFRMLIPVLQWIARKVITDEESYKMAMMSLFDFPLRNYGMGGFTNKQGIQGFVDCANGHWFKGLRKVLKNLK